MLHQKTGYHRQHQRDKNLETLERCPILCARCASKARPGLRSYINKHMVHTGQDPDTPKSYRAVGVFERSSSSLDMWQPPNHVSSCALSLPHTDHTSRQSADTPTRLQLQPPDVGTRATITRSMQHCGSSSPCDRHDYYYLHSRACLRQ